MTTTEKNLVYQEQLALGKAALQKNNFQKSLYHLENSHDIGQKNIFKHARSHFWLLILGVKTKNYKKIILQFFLIIAALLGIRINKPNK